jgi:hypothetical protein
MSHIATVNDTILVRHLLPFLKAKDLYNLACTSWRFGELVLIKYPWRNVRFLLSEDEKLSSFNCFIRGRNLRSLRSLHLTFETDEYREGFVVKALPSVDELCVRIAGAYFGEFNIAPLMWDLYLMLPNLKKFSLEVGEDDRATFRPEGPFNGHKSGWDLDELVIALPEPADIDDGFIDSVLYSTTNLRSLKFTGARFPRTTRFMEVHAPDLQHLRLQHAVDPDDFFHHFTSLQSLDLDAVEDVYSPRNVDDFPPHLACLKLRSCGIDETTIRSPLYSVTALELHDTETLDTPDSQITRFVTDKFPNLEELDLVFLTERVLTDNQLEKMGQSLRNLRRLRIVNGSAFSGSFLLYYKYFMQLESIEFRSCLDVLPRLLIVAKRVVPGLTSGRVAVAPREDDDEGLVVIDEMGTPCKRRRIE